MTHSDAIAYLVKSDMDEARARAMVEVLETLLTDDVGTRDEALHELRTSQERSRNEIADLKSDFEKLRADVTVLVATLRSEVTKLDSYVEVSASKLQTEMTTKIHDQIRYVISVVLAFIALACAASASITAFLARR